MKRTLIIAGLLWCCILSIFPQGAKNIKINEVLTINDSSVQDEFGCREAWIELANIAYSTYDVRGMFITTDKSVIDKSLSAPERIRKMSQLPNDECTRLSARRHLLLFLNSKPTRGAHHLDTKLDAGGPVWIALYDGNGVDLIDSVTVPVLKPNTSYARKNDGKAEWEIKSADAVTPAMQNYVQVSENKITFLKRNDPHGFGITVLAMGIVFSCLALLYVAFSIMGAIMKRRKRKKEEWRKTKHSRKFHLKQSHVDKAKDVKENYGDADLGDNSNLNITDDTSIEEYMAVIGMALKQYEDDAHDVESGIITITHSNRHWRNV